jgi:CYTH domain-containing protein
VHVTKIEQTYLRGAEGVETRVRKKESDSGTHYYWTEKVLLSTGVRSERERVISSDEYFYQLKERDPDKSVIKKTRYTFPYKSTYCEVDVYQEPAGLAVLEVELTSESDTYEIPPFLKVAREVTTEAEYSNAGLASLKPVV